MSQGCTYFTIPFDSVPKSPTYTVWFSSWTTVRPTVPSGDPLPFVVCCTTGTPPSGSTVLANSVKDPTPPPPPPLSAVDATSYQSTMASWLASGRGLV